jgi:SAM-dependent methyltransferase
VARRPPRCDRGDAEVVTYEPQTWHYGLVARWWAEFNTDGPEIAYFRQFVERGQPALDVACGTGRLLLPYLRAGLDVDGCDISPDMIAACRERAAGEGLSPTLLMQPMHELDPPRTYRTVFVCGGFGIGSTRAQDQEALRRFHDCLEPGGTFVLDKEVPYSGPQRWQRWCRDTRRELPAPWPEDGSTKQAADGSELTLRARLVAIDPLDQTVTMEMRAEHRRDGRVVAQEQYALTERMYFMHELLLMLERAGFPDVEVYGGYEGEAPTGDHDFLVYVARSS